MSKVNFSIFTHFSQNRMFCYSHFMNFNTTKKNSNYNPTCDVKLSSAYSKYLFKTFEPVILSPEFCYKFVI